MKRTTTSPLPGKLLVTLFGGLFSGASRADSQFNLGGPQSLLALDAYDLNAMAGLLCLGIFVVVFGAMFYSIFAHRKSEGSGAVHFHKRTSVEVIWTAIPFAILMIVAYPASKTTADHHAVDTLQYAEQKLVSR